MWRRAIETDDQCVASLCLALNEEDPGETPVSVSQVMGTLAVLRDEPARGMAVVAEREGRAVGYALLISFWSNELGGEVCVIDELFISPGFRRLGLATQLIETIRDTDHLGWADAVAIALEVAERNEIGRRFFLSRGFSGTNTAMHLARRRSEGRSG